MNWRIAVSLICLLALLGAGCFESPPVPPDTVMVRVAPDQWPELGDDLDPASLERAMEQSRAYLSKIPSGRTFKYGQDVYTAAHLLRSLDVLEEKYLLLGPGPQLTKALKEEFILYMSVGRKGQGEVLITGYYEPLLDGALAPDEDNLWPVYGLPDDLVAADLGSFSPDFEGKTIKGRLNGSKFIPYYTRHEIDREGALNGRGLEIAWVKDPVALFFLHIQGSGRIKLPDDRMVSVGYAGSNGRPYRSLGRLMIDQDLIPAEDMSMQAIKEWLDEHPDRLAEMLDSNPSYVFFKFLETGAVGNINVPLTPGRSIALDHRIFPKGAPAWLFGRIPEVKAGQITGWRNFGRPVMVQDTGGAIKGPGRVDLFFGFGRDQEAAAGRMKEPGRLYFPVLRPMGDQG